MLKKRLFALACLLAASNSRAATPNLTQQEAILQGQQISNVHYEIYLNLQQTQDYFSGKIKIYFNWQQETNATASAALPLAGFNAD